MVRHCFKIDIVPKTFVPHFRKQRPTTITVNSFFFSDFFFVTYLVRDNLQKIYDLVVDGVDRVIDDRVQRFLTMIGRNLALEVRQTVHQSREA